MRRAYSILAVLAIAFATLAPAMAVADSYGAIAYSPTTRADGWSHAFSTRADAERRALRECSGRARDCRVRRAACPSDTAAETVGSLQGQRVVWRNLRGGQGGQGAGLTSFADRGS